MLISVPVSAWSALMFLPLGPINSPIRSGGIFVVEIFGAYGLSALAGAAIAAFIDSRTRKRPTHAL